MRSCWVPLLVLLAAASCRSGSDANAREYQLQGQILAVRPDRHEVVIKHGDIKHLEMPGMTMVFAAKDKALLDKTQVGDKIRFMVINEGGKMVVTAIEPAK